ncbi:MAG: phenylalanine--tRNA ligase subunit beta [Gammaproteobacteria bacterium]|nr:phenylalanine--tRNA ligase subunit beta [Gammaproteobacteria bacterium]
MKFSEQWLREWVNPALSTDELCHQLTMAGLEVDAVEPVAASFSGVVVGEVISVAPHPDADKLRVTQVNIGAAEPLTIVCGAANVREGMKAPVAVVGAVLPGDFKIKQAKLRGVPSFGMLCSTAELGLSESASGLMELPADAPVGEDIRAYLQLDDVSIELGLTPNRSDCLGIVGIAREVAANNALVLSGPAMSPVAPAIEDTLTIKVTDSDACPRYLGRVIRGIDPGASTPLWMQERLRRCGLRSLGPVVDVTNYVLLELGQPMHAFDLGKIRGGIAVRQARAGEQLALLNDQTVNLDSDTLLIADEQGPLAMAGVMGGAASAVSDATSDIFLESAFFAPAGLAGCARRYGLHTDSSHRFERGVDPQLPRQAMERASSLLLAICGGQAGPISEVCDLEKLPRREPILLRRQRIERVLGTAIEDQRVTAILSGLDMQVAACDGGWQVVAPSFRFDIAIEVDLIEELARIVGYSQLPGRRPQGEMLMQARPEGQISKRILARTLVDRGYQEAISYSFVDPKMQALLDPQREPIALANPISADLSVMRTTLWAGLLPIMQHNLNRQQSRVRLFEQGLSFVREGDKTLQQAKLAGVVCGSREPEQWGQAAQRVDFYDVKADVEALLAIARLTDQARFVAEAHPALHPGQSARIYLGEQAIGWLGAIHPELERTLDLHGQSFVFELDIPAISQGNVPKFAEISRFPAIRRDLAFVLDAQVPAQALFDCIQSIAPTSLRELKLFDLYQGEHIDSGRKSIALGLTLQAQSRTLTDDEVDAAISTIVTTLRDQLGAIIRD